MWSNRVTDAMEKSPWEIDSCSASQEISRLLCNPVLPCLQGLSLVPILSQMNPGHNLQLCLFKIHYLRIYV
jgi:hypothetical protein